MTIVPNVTRHGQCPAWQVRVRRNGVERSRLFSDTCNYDSPALSLANAIEYRNRLKEMPISRFITNRSY